MKSKVGFMGLGIMGTAMAGNVARAGYPLSVYNRDPKKAAVFKNAEVKVASSPKALAEENDVLIAMVTGPEALDNLLWGIGGAGTALNRNKAFINMSTVSPRFTKELNEKLAPTGVVFIDAPVSGSKKPAMDGSLVILAGGRKEDVDAHTPLLETMGKKVVYCGEVGQGSMMKMTNNLLLGAMMEGLCEALNFGKLAGLEVDTVLDALLNGPLGSPIFQMKAKGLKNGDFSPAFPLKHMTKDLKFLVDTAYETGAPIPVGQMLLHLFRTGVGQQWGDLDVSAILKVLEYLTGKQ